MYFQYFHLVPGPRVVHPCRHLPILRQFPSNIYVDGKAAERGLLNDYVIQLLDDVAAPLCLGLMTYSSLIVDLSNPELPKPALVGSGVTLRSTA